MPIEYEESWNEKLSTYIPFYGEYKKKERREETDKAVREKTLSFLEHARDAADQLNTTLIQQDADELLQPVESLRSSIDNVKRSVETTRSGHSTVFDTDDPSNDRLEDIVEYDAKVIVKAKRFQKHVEELVDRAISEDIELSDVQDLSRQIQILKKDWERREDVIMDVEDIEDEVEYR